MSSTRTHSRSSDSDSSRSRSSSGSRRSKSKGRNDTYSSDYSDDFERETKSDGVVSSHAKQQKKTKLKTKFHKSGRSTVDLHTSVASRRAYGNIRKKQGWKSSSPPKSNLSHKLKKDSIAMHMMTAKQQEINDLQNELFHAKQKLSSAEKENTLLKTLQHRQDRAIRKFETTENDIPRLISTNFEDQRVLKSRLRKTQDTKRALEEKLHDNSTEMQKMEGVLQRLKKMVYDKNLGERSELSKQLSDTENNFMIAERKIESLDKKLDVTIASFTRQLNNEMQKHKETRDKMEKVREEYVDADIKLKEKERALNRSNIYTLRKKGSPEKALVPVTKSPMRKNDISSFTQTDLAITLPQKTGNTGSPNEMIREVPALQLYSPKNISSPESHSSGSSKNASHEKRRRNKNTSVFLTANFESPLSSPNTSFVKDVSDISTRGNVVSTSPAAEVLHTPPHYADQVSKNDEIETALKQKENLLSKIKEIDQNGSLLIPKVSSPQNSPKPRKLSPRSKAELVQSLLGVENDNEDISDVFNFTQKIPVESTPKKNEREISFGSYAPTVGVTPARRKAPTGGKTTKPITPTSEVDEPLFDLGSGKQNKKSDLLTQLFGNQDAVLVGGKNSLI